MVPRSFCLQNEIVKGSVPIYRNQHIFVNRKQTSIYIDVHSYDICICCTHVLCTIYSDKKILLDMTSRILQVQNA